MELFLLIIRSPPCESRYVLFSLFLVLSFLYVYLYLAWNKIPGLGEFPLLEEPICPETFH